MQFLRSSSAKFWQSSLRQSSGLSVASLGGRPGWAASLVGLPTKNPRLSHSPLHSPTLFSSARQLHVPLRRTTGVLYKGTHKHGNSTRPSSLYNHNLLLLLTPSPHLGAVSHLSSFFGGTGGGPRRPPGGNRLAQGVGILGAAGLLLGKSKYLIGALKLTKFASLGSMLLTIGTYSMVFGLPYAIGMVGLIAVHESGHAWAMHQRGIPFSPMVFIPFMGAAVVMNRMPRDAWEDAVIAIAGPVAGSLGAGAVAVAAQVTNSQLLYALADFGFMINLFNLLPIGMMDGGRISGAISPYIGVAGLGLGGLLAYSGEIQNPIFYLILLAGGYETFMRFYDPHRLPPNYNRITPLQRGTITVSYVGLIVALLAAMDANHQNQKPPEVIMREREFEKSWDMR